MVWDSLKSRDEMLTGTANILADIIHVGPVKDATSSEITSLELYFDSFLIVFHADFVSNG